VPGIERGRAVGTLTISTTYRKHCIHFSSSSVRSAGMACL
jgi:hypothetical protein